MYPSISENLRKMIEENREETLSENLRKELEETIEMRKIVDQMREEMREKWIVVL